MCSSDLTTSFNDAFMRASGDDSPVNSVRTTLSCADVVARAIASSAAWTASAVAESEMRVGSDTRVEFTGGMRSVLILGGTGWLGREIARAILATGDSVTCLARGVSGAPPEGARLVAVDRGSPEAYGAVRGEWDEVIELSWDTLLVASALDALAPAAAHWTLISTCSVYASNLNVGADETDDLVEPDDLSRYPDAKVAVERASAAALGDRLVIVRPGLIAGPGDPSDRFGYWVSRMALVGSAQVLSMETADRMSQVIDVRDLAEFTARARGNAILNAVGHPHSLPDTLERAARTAGFTGDRREAPDEWLLAHDVDYWMGPRSLPLWLPPEDIAHPQRSNAAYLAAGGSLRDLDETLRDTLADELSRGLERPRRAGLERGEELELLRQMP